MKAISLKQPWLYAVLYLGKLVENRSWATTHRGPILLHASSTRSVRYFDDCCERMRALGAEPPVDIDFVQYGGIVGRADVVDIIPRGSTDAAAREIAEKWGVDVKWWMREYNGKLQHGWILQNVEVFARMTPWRGTQSLFDVDETKLAA